MRRRNWLNQAATVLMLAIPAIGWPSLVLVQRRCAVSVRSKTVLAVFIPGVLLLLIGSILSSENFTYTIGALLLWLAVYTVSSSKRALGTSVAVFLLVTTPIALIERHSDELAWAPHPWQSSTGMTFSVVSGFSQTVRSAPPSGTWIIQSWQTTEPIQAIDLSLETVLNEGSPGNQWLLGDSDLALAYTPGVEGSQDVELSVSPKDGVFFYRAYDLSKPIANRAFRASVTYRHRSGEGANSCSGLYFQIAAPPYERFCNPLPLANDWTTVDVEWIAPEAAAGTGLRVGIEGSKGDSFSVRQLELFEEGDQGWARVGYWEPNGVRGRLEIEAPNGDRITVAASPVDLDSGRRLSIEAAYEGAEVPVGSVVRAIASIESGLSVNVGPAAINAYTASGEPSPLIHIAPTPRIKLWYGHPNLAGHVIATMGLAALVAVPVMVTPLIAALTGVLTIWTGSRAAFWVAMVVGLAIILVRIGANKKRLWIVMVGVAVTSAILVMPFLPSRLTSSGGPSQISRKAIVETAVTAILKYPFGAPFEDFASYWQSEHKIAGQDVPQHAHNIWLDVGFKQGLFGLLGIFWLTVGIGIVLLRSGEMSTLLAYGGILILNTVDVTLFFNVVPLLVALLIGWTGQRNGSESVLTLGPEADVMSDSKDPGVA